MRPFVMERWQSQFENEVVLNLSESGVHPLTLRELLELGGGAEAALDTTLGYGQSNGSALLRERIAALYADAGVEHVVVTNGSAESNFVAAWRLIEPGDGVAVLSPTYMQVPGLADGLGAAVRRVPLHEERRWQPDPDEITSAIDDGTRLVVVTNPQNPTGVRLTDAALDAVLDAAARVGAWVLADEVYAGAEPEGDRTPSLFGRYERVIVTGSLSKAYGLPGLRIGWAVSPADLTEDLWARKDYTTIAPGPLTDGLAALALSDAVRPRVVERARALIRENLRVVRDWIDHVGCVIQPEHDAGAVCFPRYDLPIDSLDLAERLRVEEDVLIVPGAHFEMGPFLRIGFGIERGELERALDRVGAFMRRL